MYKTGKNIRRLITLLMAVIVMAAMTANICYKVKAADGDGIEWSYDKATKTLKIWGSGEMADYSYTSGAPWNDKYRKDIETVIISEGVTSIGERAFYGCSLSSISIPNGVTSIGDGAFDGCSSLSNISIPSSVTSIGDTAFYGCSSLSSISIPNGVTSIGILAFYGCSSLSSISIPSSVTSIGREAFRSCSSLSSISIPDSVTSIGSSAFEGCSSLSSISIPDSVTKIGSIVFYNCSSLSSITVEEGNKVYDSRENCNAIIETSSNTLIAGCKSTIIPYGVTSIGRAAFDSCSSLSSISIPDSVTSIGRNAFESCSSLSSISIPDSVTSIGGNAFGSCSSLSSITVEEGNKVYDSRENCNAIIETSSNTLIAGCKSTIIPYGVTSIGSDAFWGCSSLSSISIPDSVTSIGYGAFIGCSSLRSITIPSSVTSIDDTEFSSNCSKNLTIYGEENSYAQTYAKKYGIAFKIIPMITDAGLFMAENTREHILIGVVTSTSGQADIEYRWSAKDSSGAVKVIKDWTLNNEWLDWTPDSFGEYTLTAEARVAANPSSSKTVEEVVFFNPYIKGKCQVPYAMVAPGQPGYLIGVETYENPNQSYQYEMLILDCTLLAEGKDAWVYTTGKFTVTEGAAGWCVWQPQYGYYWTLFRVYDAEGNMIDQACYPFVNAY